MPPGYPSEQLQPIKHTHTHTHTHKYVKVRRGKHMLAGSIRKAQLHLTLEQHGFEPHGSTYMQIFFNKDKYLDALAFF